MAVEIGIRFFFMVAFVGFAVGVALLPKTEEKLSFLAEILASTLLVMCYGAVAAGVCKIIKIPVNVGTMGIVYFLPGLAVWAALVIKKKVQKLTISKLEMVSVALLSLVFLAVELTIFSYEMRPSYNYGTDAGNHLGAALNIVRTDEVSGMHFAAFHNAMVIDIFTPFLEEIKYYKGFVLADTLGVYFQMLFMFVMIYQVAKKKITKYLAPVLTLLCWAGYPMYSYIEGHYVYWGWGAILVCFLFYEVVQYKEKSRSSVGFGITMIAGFCGVVLCYNLFAPVVLWGLLILGMIEWKKRKITFTKKTWIMLGVGVLFCVLVALFGYFSFFHGVSRYSSILESLKMQGACYRNLYGDFLWTLPVILVFCAYCFKKKEMHTYGIVYLSLVALQVLILGAFFLGLISGYYYYKFYFPIWIMHWVVIALAIDRIKVEENERKYVYAYAAVYGFTLLSAFTHAEERLNEVGPGWLTEENSMGHNLYYRNMQTMQSDFEAWKYSTAQLEICQYVMENLRPTGEVVAFAGWEDCRGPANWYVAITGMQNFLTHQLIEAESWEAVLENTKFNYYVVLKSSALYKDNTEYFESKTWVFENEEGFIVKK